MRLARLALLLPFLLAACATTPRYGTPTALTCVPYARAVTGIDLSGNARRWWHEAAGRYPRAHAPAIGAILVFRRHGAMTDGHLAVVTGIDGPREIEVTQANWLPGRIEHGIPVFDVSPANDWTAVRVWYEPSGAPGITTYPTDGFILPDQPRSPAALARLATGIASR